jgi:hypothetical protein
MCLYLSMHLFMKKSKILTSIPQNLVIYHTKNLHYHIKHTLLYLWSKYGAIWTNIVSPVEFFFIKLCSETQFLNHLSRHLKTYFNHPSHKNHHHFNQKVCEYLTKKENLLNKLFCKCNDHSK